MSGENQSSLATLQASVVEPARRGLQWWIDTLVGSLPPLLRYCCSPRKQELVLRISGEGATLVQDTDAGAREAAVSDPPLFASIAADVIPERATGLEIGVQVAADSVLHRSVTWPLETEANLDKALGFQLDRLIPLPADAVYFGYRVNRRDKRSNQLGFDLVAVPKSQVDPWLQAIDSSPFGGRLMALWAEPTGRAVNLLPEEARRQEAGGLKLVRQALWGLLILLLAAVVVLPFIEQQRELDLQETALAGAMAKANDVRSSADAVEAKTELVRTLAAEASDQTYHAAVLAELARLLPDSAYLQRVTVKGGEVRVVGLADNSLELVDLLSDSPWFVSVEFVSKVTRDTRSGKDRFQLRLKAGEGS